MERKYLLYGLIAAIILVLILAFLHVGTAGASYHKWNWISPTPTYQCEGDDCIEVNPTVDPSVTPEVTPVASGEAATNQYGLPGDGQSDGKSDGLSSCPKCTQAPDAPSPYDGAKVGWK